MVHIEIFAKEVIPARTRTLNEKCEYTPEAHETKTYLRLTPRYKSITKF